MPEGYQLIKLKEFILDSLALGTRKEVVAAFWEYILARDCV
jgi:chromatin remodeling complex protein RSC6